MAFTAQFEPARARLVVDGDCRMDDVPELTRALAAARLAAPPSLSIEAEAALGIGPSWLLREFVVERRAAGARVEFAGASRATSGISTSWPGVTQVRRRPRNWVRSSAGCRSSAAACVAPSRAGTSHSCSAGGRARRRASPGAA